MAKRTKAEYMREYRKRPAVRERQYEHQRRWLARNQIDVHRIRKYIANAQRRGITWALTTESALAILVQPCTYCGVCPSQGNGIDRVDNDQGYVPYNCVAACWPCNRMKGKMSARAFSTHAAQVSWYSWQMRLRPRWLDAVLGMCEIVRLSFV